MSSPDDKDEARKSPVGGSRTTPYGTPSTGDATVEFDLTDATAQALAARYDLLAELGRGGMGVVYKARDRETDEVIALKVLRPEVAARPDLIERFKSELRLARKITHKNVCRVYDINRFGSVAAISMEYVQGESLRAVLDRFGGVPLRRGLEWVGQVCSALAEAHAQGVVHRDLKPENIVITRDSVAKVMDFGIARSLDAGATATAAGMLIGTPAYMSPEQAEGKPVDARSDIYSLGLVMYEMFTGRRAFEADTAAALAVKHIHDTPPPPRSVEPLLPAVLARAIEKCLEKNPKKRFQSAAELAAALEQHELPAEPAPAAATPEPAELPLPPHLAAWQRSDSYLFGAALLGLFLFVILFSRFHPAAVLQIPANAVDVRASVASTLERLGWGKPIEIEAINDDVDIQPDAFYQVAMAHGLAAARQSLRENSGGWYGQLTLFDRPGRKLWGRVTVDRRGRLTSFSTLERGDVTPGDAQRAAEARAELGSNQARRAELQKRAEGAVKEVYGLDVSGAEPAFDIFLTNEAAVSMFEWRLQRPSTGVPLRIYAAVDGLLIRQMGVRLDYSRLPSFDPGWGRGPLGLQGAPAPRIVLGFFLVFLFALLLFLVRRLFRQPRSPANLRLALAGGLIAGLGVFVLSRWDPEARPDGVVPNWFSLIVEPLLAFALCSLFSYAILTTLLYYLSRSYPAAARNYRDLLLIPLAARPVGLELVRGSLVGLAFVGLWMVLIYGTGLLRVGWPAMLFWLEFGPFLHASFPFVFVGEALLYPLLMVAFPLSLLARVTPRVPVLLAMLALLWLVFGLSLAGAAVVPSLPYHLVLLLQAVFFGWLFLRFGLLATISAALTVEAFLMAYPLLYIYGRLEPLPYQAALLLWSLVFAAGALIYLRPHLGAAWRRVAAVFE